MYFQTIILMNIGTNYLALVLAIQKTGKTKVQTWPKWYSKSLGTLSLWREIRKLATSCKHLALLSQQTVFQKTPIPI